MLPPTLHSSPLLFFKIEKGFLSTNVQFLFVKSVKQKIAIKIHYLHPAISAHAPQACLKRLIFEPTNTHCTNIVNKGNSKYIGKRNHKNSHHKEKGATKTSLFRKIKYMNHPSTPLYLVLKTK
jgi:hypothetical protein